MMSTRTSNDPRRALASMLLAVLAATLFLADRALDGSAQTVARIVLVAAVLAAVAWTGSVFRAYRRPSVIDRLGDDVATHPKDVAAQAQDEAPGGTAALVLGIVGLVLLPLIGSVIAVVLGRRAREEALAHPERYRDSLGRAGRVLGWVGIAAYGAWLALLLIGRVMWALG